MHCASHGAVLYEMVHVYPNLSDQNFNSIKGNYLWNVVPFMAFSIEYLLKFEFGQSMTFI